MRVPIIVLCLSLCAPSISLLNAQDCECTNCPQFMQDLFVGDFNINIQGATNNMLGQNGQGVCGVIVHWDHTAICDISITLTAPSGQTITLVGPIGQFCTNMGNTGTDWNVTFLPCGSGAIPDPGFTAQWNNNQNWGANNNYTGSYYPFNGCLQNLTGPVNGNWVLTVTDGQANDVGNLYDYEIIFCDPSGINCQSCEPDAGVLSQPDVAACEGDGSLLLDLPPNYPPPSVEPSAPDYAYTYLVGGSGGVIQAITQTPDLTAAQPGTYTVCGLSYLSAHTNLLPTPNGTLTIQQLTNQLSSNTPPFCGDVTTNCVNVTVFPIPPDEETFEEICSPACFDFLGQFYCQTGDYSVEQTDANGCIYHSILHLKVKSPSYHSISEMVCVGDCSTHPLFPDACSQGQYMLTLTNQAGCDSILTLNLNVMTVDAVIQQPDTITCTQMTVPLMGSGSTLGGGTNYLWTASNGGMISGPNNLINATAAAPGTYKLRVCRTVGLTTCCDSATVNVVSSILLPGIPVIRGSDTLCVGQIDTFTVKPVANASSYTWSVPPGDTILSGQGDTLIVVQWNSPSNGPICVFAVNACGSGQDSCLNITAALAPTLPVLHGQVIACRDTVYEYYVDPVTGASINWQITGGVILSGLGTDTVSVAWNSSGGSLCATAVNHCGQSQPVCLIPAIGNVPAQPVVTGDTTLCSGATGNYVIASLAGALGYVWTVPAGATILSGQNTTSISVDWPAGTSGNVCVHGFNDCGNGPDQCLPVAILQQPTADAGIDNAVCDTTINLMAIPGIAGSTGIWTQVSGTGTAVFGNNQAATTNVSVSLNGAYQFQWQENNGICSDVDTVLVTFRDSPTGNSAQPTCDNTNQNYTVTINISGGTAPYSTSTGTINGSVFTSDPIPNGQSYVFVINDANGCASAPLSGVFNCNCSTNAGQMSLQPLTACNGTTVTATAPQNTQLDADDIGAYTLHTNSGSVLGAILGQNTTGVFGFVNGMSFGTTYYISYVVGNNLNGSPDLTDPCLSVAPGQPVTFFDNPPANAGMDASSCTLTQTVNGNSLAGSTSVWSVASTPSGGTAALSTPQNPSTGVTVSQGGVYTLTYTVTANGCTASDQVQLTFGNPPIAGTAMPVCDPTNQFFTVQFNISGGQSPFNVNGQPVAGSTFVSQSLNSGASYSFTITDANGCTAAPVTGSFTCSCATNAGQVSLTTITACQSDSITVQLLGGQVLDADDVGAFVLHTGSGAALGTIIHQNHTGRFGYWATMDFGATYYVSPVAGNGINGFPDPNDPCFSVSPGQPIVFIQDPFPNAGDDFVVCGLTANMPAIPTIFGGIWSQISGPASAVFDSLQDPLSPIEVPMAGTYVFRWTETNGMCSKFDDVEVEFWDNPVIGNLTETCNNTNTGYTISFTVNGAATPFSVSGIGGAFSGNTFTSEEITNGGAYNIILQDGLGCQSVPASGTFMCPCGTFAGTMDTAPAIFCADQPASVVWNNDAMLDANDGVQFILHDQAGNTLGTVLAKNNQPQFSFGPGMQTGTTYYISAVAGNANGLNVDLTDVCLNVAQGTPVQWKALPSAAISGDATICSGSSTVLNFNGMGSFPLQLTYDDGSGSPVQLAIPNQQTIPVSVSPASTTTYLLQSVSDGTLPTCSATLTGSVTVTVNQPVNAGQAEVPQELCAGDLLNIQLGTLITGEDPGGQWSETSVLPSQPGSFNPNTGALSTGNQTPGTYTFRYFLQGALPCPSESSTATVIVHPTPVADAGADQFIDCHQDTVMLGGSGTSTGPGLTYVWSLNGNTVGTAETIRVGQGGDYSLSVTNGFGCSDADETTVTLNDDIPRANVLIETDVRCYGENNGSIVLDSIESLHPPVMFSINGSPFSSNNQFEDLTPGTYTITLQDNNGCEWSTQPVVIDEPALLTVDLDPQVTAILGDSVQLVAQSSVQESDLARISWSPLFDSLHANTLLQEFRILKSSYVTIAIADSNGCSATARVLVRIERPEQVYIPNIIKPGSGNFNDRLTVYGGPGVAEIKSFRIFDRWGEQLFEALNFAPNDMNISWTGTFRGQNVNPGVYVYVAEVRFIDGEESVYKGDVTVIR